MEKNDFLMMANTTEFKVWSKKAEAELKAKYGVTVKVDVRYCSYKNAMDTIAKLVSKTLSVPMDEILYKTKFSSDATDARRITAHLAKKYISGITFKEIGSYFKRDHTSVIRLLEKLKELESVNDDKIMTKLPLCENELLKYLNTNHGTDI